MDLNIKLSYSGSTKGAEYLSQGYQDLVALCSRYINCYWAEWCVYVVTRHGKNLKSYMRKSR